jgi:hypothetical protein
MASKVKVLGLTGMLAGRVISVNAGAEYFHADRGWADGGRWTGVRYRVTMVSIGDPFTQYRVAIGHDTTPTEAEIRTFIVGCSDIESIMVRSPRVEAPEGTYDPALEVATRTAEVTKSMQEKERTRRELDVSNVPEYGSPPPDHPLPPDYEIRVEAARIASRLENSHFESAVLVVEQYLRTGSFIPLQ